MNFDELVKEIDPAQDYTIAQSSKLTRMSYTAIKHRVDHGHLPFRIILNRKYIKGIDLIKAMTNFE